MKNLIYFRLLWDCYRCKDSFSSHHPSGCVVCYCTKYWGWSWGISPELWGNGSKLKGVNPSLDNGKSDGNKTEKLLMPKDKLQASSLPGDRYSLLIFKLWFPAFRKLRCTELYLAYMFYIAFAVIIRSFCLKMRFAKYKKAALGKSYQNTLLCFSYFQTPSNIYITSKEAKTGNWAERRVGNSKHIESSEIQKVILMFTHILMLQEDRTIWHKLNSLCQPVWCCTGSMTKPGCTGMLALFSDQSEP